MIKASDSIHDGSFRERVDIISQTNDPSNTRAGRGSTPVTRRVCMRDILSAVRAHDRIDDEAERREITASDGARLRSLLRLHRRSRDAAADDRIPYVVLPSIFLNEALGPTEHSRDEGELSTPV